MSGNAPPWFNAEITARALLSGLTRERRKGPVDLFLCITDHFEPQVGRASRDLARRRLEDWLTLYPKVAARHRDAEGRHPAHGFFYPWDEFDSWEFERLAELCAEGWGEIELHLHHRGDTEGTLRQKLREATGEYARLGALSRWPDGRPAFGFIHGNWSLDNSRHDHAGDYCGVNSELTLLQEAGCYADFTFPAWRYTAQPRTLNQIYYATDDPAAPKSYDRGIPAQAGTRPEGLLMVPGPLVPYLAAGRRPRLAMDDGDLAACRRYRPERLDRWVRQGISVRGRPDQVYIKLYCHGAADENRRVLLEEDLDALFQDAEARYNDGERYRLHYVTAREIFNLIKAAERAMSIPISQARDWLLPPAGTRGDLLNPSPTPGLHLMAPR